MMRTLLMLLLAMGLAAFALAGCADDGTTTPVPGEDVGGGDLDDGSTADAGDDAVGCTPDCTGRTCGDNGCGGSCGDCVAGQDCVAGVCEGGTGTGIDCNGIIECIQPCTDQGCFTNCIGQGTPEAQDQFNAIIACIQTRCADVDPSDETAMIECQNTECGGEIAECTGQAPPEFGDATCEEVIDCLFGCTTEDCQNECVGTGTPAAQAAAIGLYNCGVENCVDEAPNGVDAFLACTEESCTEEFDACYPPPFGDATCEEVVDCADDCDGDDDDCADACLDDGTEDAQDLAETFFECAIDECSDLEDEVEQLLCVIENCEDEAVDCFELEFGEAGCAEVFACGDECEDDDSDCWTDCVTTGDLRTQAAAESIGMCADDNCADLDDGELAFCLADECGDSIAICEEGMTCEMVADCGLTCDPTADGDDCRATCETVGSVVANIDWGDLWECVGADCADVLDDDDALEACAYENCSDEVVDCFALTVGDGTCIDILDCAFECAEDDDACIDTCGELGTLAEQATFWDLVDCMDTGVCEEVAEDEFFTCLVDECAAPASCLPTDE